ncbi:MAG: ferrochelatase [Hyphomicrobiaceae bacterium]|nr:ferrochelatase [Hyphomicrobiaceae bacterium]MCC0024083.1 ferrochelatase [Hyphomicrobiaceae bacterium]
MPSIPSIPKKPSDHPAVPPRKVGVLLLNLGTPDDTDFWSMRRYLKEFLWDKRVIETPRIVWWLVLNLIILNTRPQKSGATYRKIWDYEKGDSPLRLIAKSQAEKLAKRFAGSEVIVDFAMRYGNPSTEAKIKALKEQGCDRILLFPLYPQYSAPTTATANDKAFDVLKSMRWQPAVRTVPAYFDDPAYIKALAASVSAQLAGLDFEPEKIVTSYHGMPQSYLEAGDPYHCQCIKTTRLLALEMGLEPERFIVSFQSRFGPDEWLKPYTDETLAALPGQGVHRIAILAPAFSVDCLETLEEIAMEGRETFMEAGGDKYAYLSCLNDSDDGMAVIEAIARKELSGWV